MLAILYISSVIRRVNYFYASLILSCFIFLPAIAYAHTVPYMAITTELWAEGKTVNFRTEINAPINLQETEGGMGLEEQFARIRVYYEEYFVILYGETPEHAKSCSVSEIVEYNVNLESGKTVVAGSYECPEEITELSRVFVVTDIFSDAFVAYDHYITLRIGQNVRDYIFTQWILTSFEVDQAVLDKLFPNPESNMFVLANFSKPKSQQPISPLFYVIKSFTFTGVTHIFSGIDHILFLLATILTLGTIRQMLAIVTAFTIAHSITLILAGLGYIILPAYVVEPLIIATIVFVVARELLFRKRNRGTRVFMAERWGTTFCFGLIHGLGFAGALADFSVPSRYFIPALLTFNVGIELGQLAILSVAVLLILTSKKIFKASQEKILFVAMLLIGLVAIYWLIERLFADGLI